MITSGKISRHRGIAVIYVAMCIMALLGFCSLAVDFGRVQVAKTELRRAADAAARAACANLGNGAGPCKNAAVAMAALNTCDGTAVSVGKNTDVQFIKWIGPGNYSVVNYGGNPNGVRVFCRRTAANGNPISLLFAGVLGMSNCDVTASAIAVNTVTSVTQNISAKSNPWLAGESTGTLASVPDGGWPSGVHPWKYDIAGPVGGSAASGEPYESPVQVSFNVSPGAHITFTNVTGLAANDGTNPASFTATGTSGGNQSIYDNDASGGVGEHGMSDVWAPLNSMLGVFLTSSVPDGNSVPPVLDFSTLAARDYTTLSPKNQQVFYIGSGQTSTSTQQTIIVPQGATRFFMGTMDGHEWSNNIGGFTATITQSNITLVN